MKSDGQGSGTDSNGKGGSPDSKPTVMNLVKVRSECVSGAKRLLGNAYTKKSSAYRLLQELVKTRLTFDHQAVKDFGLKNKFADFLEARYV